MEHIIKKLKKGAAHTRLSVDEKNAMKSALLSYMRSHEAEKSVFSVQDISTFPFVRNLRNRKTLSAFVLAGLLVGGTVSFAAEGTVPGDVLFPVKIHVNENVRGVVAITQKAKAEWKIDLVERRLKEVEALVVIPDASPIRLEVAKQNLSEYTREVESRIEKFEKGNEDAEAVMVSKKLSNVFNVHEEILMELNKKEKRETDELANSRLGREQDSSLGLTQGATSTEEVSSSRIKTMEDVIGKVRGERVHAEKKHNELRKKYRGGNSDDDEDSVRTESSSSSGGSTQGSEGPSRNNRNSEVTPNGKSSGFEIRSSVNFQNDIEWESAEVKNETRKEDGRSGGDSGSQKFGEGRGEGN